MFNKVCNRVSQLMLVWVILAGIAGYARPATLVWMQPHLELLFALTMFGIGMVTNPKDYEPMFKKPKIIFLGMAAQFGIMPLSAFIVAKALSLPPDIALGLILAGAAPDAMAAGVVSYAAHADVAYAVAMTSVSTLLAPVLTPAFTYIFGKVFVSIPVLPMVLSIVKMVILPLAAGFTVKHYFKANIEKVEAFFPAVSSLFIAAICGLVVALNKRYILEISFTVFIAVALLNIMGLYFGYLAGALYRFDVKKKRTLAISVGMQNAGLGAVLAIKHFSAQAAVPNAIFATWCIISASILAWYWNIKDNAAIRRDTQTHTTPKKEEYAARLNNALKL